MSFHPGDIVHHHSLGTGEIISVGIVHDDHLMVYPLRDEEGELVFNSSGNTIATGMALGTKPEPVPTLIVRFDTGIERLRGDQILELKQNDDQEL